MMTPVIGSPMAMLNLPSVVEHTTGPVMFCGWPSTVTLADPDPGEAAPDTVAVVELVVALGDVVVLDEVLGDLVPLEQPATPVTTIVAAPTTIKSSRFTDFSSVLWPGVVARGIGGSSQAIWAAAPVAG